MATAQRLSKWTTLEDLERSTIGPVWALNNTARTGEPGNLVLSVPKPNGNGNDAVRIRRTFVPIDLTLQAPRLQLLASSEFRTTIQKGLIRLCTPEYAQAILNTEEGKEEKRRIDNLLMQSNIAIDNASIVGGDDEDEDNYFDPNNMEGAVLSADGKKLKAEIKEKELRKDSVTASLQIQTIANNAKNENWTQVRVIGALRTHNKFSEADVRYLKNSFEDKPKVVAFLKEVYSKIKAKKAKASTQ